MFSKLDYINKDIAKATKAKKIGGGQSEASKNYEYGNLSNEE